MTLPDEGENSWPGAKAMLTLRLTII